MTIPIIDDTLSVATLPGQTIDGRLWEDGVEADHFTIISSGGHKIAINDPTGGVGDSAALPLPAFTGGTLTGEAFLQISGTGSKQISILLADNPDVDNQLAAFSLITPEASPFTGETTFRLENADDNVEDVGTITGGSWIPFTLTLVPTGYTFEMNGITLNIDANPVVPAEFVELISTATSPATRQGWQLRLVSLVIPG